MDRHTAQLGAGDFILDTSLLIYELSSSQASLSALVPAFNAISILEGLLTISCQINFGTLKWFVRNPAKELS